MVTKSVTLRVPNSILFIWDLENPNASIPEYQDNTLVSHNDGCVSVGTRLETDGETTVSFVERPSSKSRAVFCGRVSTPSGTLSVSTSAEDGILVARVGAPTALLTIFANDHLFPSEIGILVE